MGEGEKGGGREDKQQRGKRGEKDMLKRERREERGGRDMLKSVYN